MFNPFHSSNLALNLYTLKAGLDIEMKEGFKLDPITFEILRNRLWAINDEGAATLRLISGSPVVTEVNDYNTALMKPDGEVFIIGAYISAHAISMEEVVRYILRDYKDNPGVHRDDMFICNDPYVGALHQGDVICVAPIHWKDELVAWTGVTTHHVDVGGSVGGSAQPGAKSIYEEAPPIPPLKIVERGIIRKDIEREFLRRSRTPTSNALDLRGQIGANNVAKRRVLELIDKYGLNCFKAVMDGIIDYTETRFRKRLKELPDGIWRHVSYVDYEDEIYSCSVAMRKEWDNLTLDFSKTSKQAPSLINCTYPVLRAYALSVILSYLCFDIPWCPSGVMKAVEIISEPGTLLHALWPAGVSKSTTTAYFVVMNLVSNCIAKMMAASDKYRDRLMATWMGSCPLNEMFGVDQRGHDFGTMILDAAMGGGGGARSYKDGIDTGGFLGAPLISIANVETHEFRYPLLYIYRRQQRDSGGPGKFRGGVGISLMYTIHDVDEIPFDIMHAFGVEQPESVGMYGGYPGSTCYYTIKRNSNIQELFNQGKVPGELEELDGQLEVEPAIIISSLKKGDVYRCVSVGGGGYGDPIDRDSELVLKDVKDGKVSLECAGEIYGVIIDPKAFKIDIEETQRQRQALRKRRAHVSQHSDKEINYHRV